MKKYLIGLLLTVLTFSSLYAQQCNNFILNGTIINKDSGRLYLRYTFNSKKVIDSAELKNGKFSFMGFLDEPTKAELLRAINTTY